VNYPIRQWGAIEETSQALALGVAATFLGNPMDEMSDRELKDFTDPVSAIIADVTAEVGAMLGYEH
jgi:hypothetical protein